MVLEKKRCFCSLSYKDFRTCQLWVRITTPLPGFKPPRFFLWVFLKDGVYINRSQSIQALKANITTEISQITRETRENVMKNFQKRLEVCLQRNRGHLEHVIKKKDD